MQAPLLSASNERAYALGGEPTQKAEPQVLTAVALLPKPGTVMLARPLWELCAHITHCKIPSFKLIARAIKVLVLAIFKWHFCDHVLLWANDQKLYHNISGKDVQEIANNDLYFFELTFPSMLQSALYCAPKIGPNDPMPNSDDLESSQVQTHYKQIDTATYVQLADFKDINPQVIREYYFKVYKRSICDKTTNVTTYDLLKSPAFKHYNWKEIRKFS